MTHAVIASGAAPVPTSAHWRHAQEHLLPSTFEERGAFVPFTTPALAYAKVRRDWRGRLELVIGQFAGTAGSYIVPWPAVGDLFALTIHDILLHEEVVARNALDPHSVRMAALEVARTGLAGPAAADAACRTLKLEEEYRALTEVVLIVKVIEQVERSAAALLLRNVGTADGREQVRRTLAKVGARIGLEAVDFEARLDRLGAATFMVGIGWCPEPGRLRQILDRLRGFQRAVAAWGLGRFEEQADQARFCADVAAHSVAIATGLVAQLDGLVADPLRLLKDWPTCGHSVERLAQRLAWLLDGWGPLIEQWADCATDAERTRTLGEIVPALPLVPRGELKDTVMDLALSSIGVLARRWVRTAEDWRTGTPDSEMIKRLEALRARQL